MKKIISGVLITFTILQSYGQYKQDSLQIRKFFNEALTNNTAYENLRYLCKEIGGRICCSPQSEKAIIWAFDILTTMNLDTVYKQECMVRCWTRGEKEYAKIHSDLLNKTYEPSICALGGSTGTGEKGITANVIELHSLEELKTIEPEKIKGKIIFFNRPANPLFINTFRSYGSAADQRVYGATEAAKYGASAIVVRSLSLATHQYCHTGIMHYREINDSIPAIAISTKDADYLSLLLKNDPELTFYFRTTCYENPPAISYNVIGELRGTEKPDEIICFGGHVDAWDNGEGAHDDGVGVIHTIEALRLLQACGYKPRHTLRVIVFMDEEIGQSGGQAYAEYIKKSHEKVIAAIESDRGGFVPTGFSIDADDEIFNIVKSWAPLFLEYGLYNIERGYSGVDIGFLKELNVPLFALSTETQRYFDYQHSDNDNFENVNKRELQLGSASVAMLVYLIDRYELNPHNTQ